jgi:ADP-ribose pyrophosphatase
MPIKPWKIRESSYLRPGFRVDQCELPNGKSLEPVVLEFRSWANILAVTKNREAVFIKQYRHGVQDILWEIPGGVVEDNEDPAEGVKRELLEETGYAASNVVQVGKFYPNPALQTNTMYCFLALDVEKAGEQHLDNGEQIEVHLVQLEEVLTMPKRGEFPHALQVAVLFYAFTYMDCI